MSESNDIYVHELLMLKLTNKLTKAQQAEIDALIARDPKVAERWEELLNFFQNNPIHRQHFEEMSSTDIMDGVFDKMKQRGNKQEKETPEELEPRAAEVWKVLEERFNKEEQLSRKSFEGMSQAEIAEGIMERKEYYKPRTSLLKKWLLIAAATIGIGTFSIYIFTKTNHSSQPLAGVHHNIPRGSVYLETADGDVFDLSDNVQFHKTGNGKVTLNNNRNILTFIADRNNGSRSKLVVPAGKEYAVRLSDGTEIKMNSGSILEFPFGFPGNTREITLTGEAYIKVATTPEKPFTVHTPDANIQVLGTEFNVATYNKGQATVSLVQGSVKVKAGEQEVVLKPGFQADYTTQKGINTQPFDKNNVLSWLEGKYEFNRIPLKEIIPILERWYDVKIIPDNPAVIEKTFKGQINKSEGIRSFLEMLELISDAEYYYKNDTIHIK
jgi:transmembrane sensor